MQLRPKVNNNCRVRKSPTVQRIENDIVLRDDDTAKRSRRLLLPPSRDGGFIRDAYFENDVRSGIEKMTKSSKTRIQIGVRCTFQYVIFETPFLIPRDDYSYDPLSSCRGHTLRMLMSDAKFSTCVTTGRRGVPRRPCAASLNLRARKSLRRN